MKVSLIYPIYSEKNSIANLIKSMSKECIKTIKGGTFPVGMRNKKLKYIYGDAVK